MQDQSPSKNSTVGALPIFFYLLCAALVVIVIISFGPLPEQLLNNSVHLKSLTAVQQASAESSIRGSVLQAVGGVLLVVGAVTAWRQLILSRQQHTLDRQVAITEAFAKAVEHIGSQDAIGVRLGGIYSLDRIADNDPSEKSRVASILTAFIREHSSNQQDVHRDVHAAITVLARRAWPTSIDLSSTYLRGISVPNAILTSVLLEHADLGGAILRGADMRNTDLRGADLREADLRGVNLDGAQLSNARMSGARADTETKWPTGYIPTDHGIQFS